MIDADDVRLSFVGAHAKIEILPEIGAPNGRYIQSMRSVRLQRGEVVRIGSLIGGAVLYVGVEGGFDIQPVLGSLSTYIRGGFGGWQGRALVAGDWLPLRQASASEREECELPGFDLSTPPRFRTILGPQNDHFADREIAAFFDNEYVVSPGADRMGMRLDGYRLDHAKHTTFVSDGIAPGSIQVPGNGQPIEEGLVDLADRPQHVLLEQHCEVLIFPLGFALVVGDAFEILDDDAGPKHRDDRHPQDRSAASLGDQFRQLQDVEFHRHISTLNQLVERSPPKFELRLNRAVALHPG